MRAQPLAFVLILIGCVMAQNRQEYHMFNVPGTLESALSLSGQSVVRRELGSLTPPGTFTLFAVVAVDQASKRSVKGLEVQVEGDDIWNGNRHCKKIAYIDEVALSEFEQRLTVLMKSEKSDQRHSEVPSLAFAGNSSSADPKEGEYYVPLQVGSYWAGDRYGLYVDAPYDRITWRDGCQFNMPKADVNELLTAVRKGREWLEGNSPSSRQPARITSNDFQ